jgi:hypothetical protein
VPLMSVTSAVMAGAGRGRRQVARGKRQGSRPEIGCHLVKEGVGHSEDRYSVQRGV